MIDRMTVVFLTINKNKHIFLEIM